MDVRRRVIAGWTLVGVLGVMLACADRPAIVFANHLDRPVSVHVGGDRVLILAPHTTERLPYQVAAWTWPRKIESRDYATGQVLSSFRASAGDLANRRWRVEIR
jgi:hypothetical protein